MYRTLKEQQEGLFRWAGGFVIGVILGAILGGMTTYALMARAITHLN